MIEHIGRCGLLRSNSYIVNMYCMISYHDLHILHAMARGNLREEEEEQCNNRVTRELEFMRILKAVIYPEAFLFRSSKLKSNGIVAQSADEIIQNNVLGYFFHNFVITKSNVCLVCS